MKAMMVVTLLLGAQLAIADVPTRAAAAKAVHANPEARNYNFAATGPVIGAAMQACAPPGTALRPEDAAFTLVADVSAQGKATDIAVEPAGSIASCVATKLQQARLPAPPAGFTGDKGFPLLIEMKLTSGGARAGAPRHQVIVMPVFSQIVAFSQPEGFGSIFSNTTATGYVHEFVPQGQSAQNWTQMVTLTGAKDAALNPEATPAAALQSMGARIRQRCPESFLWKPLGKLEANGHEGFAALLGCGTTPMQSGEARSEVVFVAAFRGSADIYTLQWAERAAAIASPPVPDEAVWGARFRQLLPIRVCKRVPGEPAPYPSCVDPPAAAAAPASAAQGR